ncbi:MAG TPA: tetratricopeptide repeat protein, partial [Tepidisphaeraceae bacterium]|nr:tetratricopeptide repeat protein [Tepidisphaeraceae bacterium]
MSLRPKTVRRLAILSAVGAVTVGSVGFFWHRERQREFAEIESARHTGFDALKRGDYELAITDLRRYVTAHPEDVTALFALAQARVSVAQPNNAHLGEARQLLLQVLSLDPKHVDARRKLMSLYARARFSKELQEQADALLVQIPNDPESLRYRAIALAAQNKPTETLSAWTTYTNAKPDDILAQMETLVAMRRTGKSLDDVIVRAKKLIQDYPEDARFLIPLAWAHLERNEPTEALALLDKVSQNAQLDLDVARVVLDQYDRAGEFDRAQQLLERASQFQNDPKFSTLLIDRLWQRGQYETCVARIDDLNDNVRNLPRTQAIKAFSLRELGKTEDARTVAMVLAKKSDDVD